VEGLAEKLGLNATVPYTAWFEGKQVSLLLQLNINQVTYHQEVNMVLVPDLVSLNFCSQVGGWTQVIYGDILAFTTIRGGSHMAPFSSPARSLALFAAFLSGKPLV